MTAASWAAICIAIASLISAGTGVVALFRRVGTVSTRVDEVHKLVNNQLDRQLVYSQQLTAALTEAGEPVPEQEAGAS
jgi:hypothetical protein